MIKDREDLVKKVGNEKVEIIEKAIEERFSQGDINILKKTKEIFNKWFGEENNQIIKPTAVTFANMADGFPTYIARYGKEHIVRLMEDNLTQFYRVIVKFPEVKISNSRKGTHTIKDLFVRFHFRPNMTLSPGLQGIRATVSLEEYYACYFHSHLDPFDPNTLSFSHFCTGVGDINQIIALLSSKFNEVNLILFCQHLKNFVAWESIEGTPYIRMDSIGSTSSSQAPQFAITELTRIFNALKKKLSEVEIEKLRKLFVLELSNNKYEVKATEQLEMFLGDIFSNSSMPQIFSGVPNTYMNALKGRDGKYYSTDAPRARGISYRTTPLFTFKDKEIFFKVETIEHDEKEKSQQYANPQITEHLCKFFTSEFSKILYKTKGIELLSASNNIGKTTGTDTIPL